MKPPALVAPMLPGTPAPAIKGPSAADRGHGRLTFELPAKAIAVVAIVHK